MGSLTRRITAEGIYGSLAVAVVCLAWEGEDLGELAAEVVVYAVALWLFHIYARVVYAGWRDRGFADLVRWGRHEWPHLEAALPALGVVLGRWCCCGPASRARPPCSAPSPWTSSLLRC